MSVGTKTTFQALNVVGGVGACALAFWVTRTWEFTAAVGFLWGLLTLITHIEGAKLHP